MEKYLEFNLDIHLLFIDYLQAFNSINRMTMNIALIKNGVFDKIIKLITVTLSNKSAKMKIGKIVIDSFHIESVVRQESILSVTLFNIALHETIFGIIKSASFINESWQICV